MHNEIYVYRAPFAYLLCKIYDMGASKRKNIKGIERGGREEEEERGKG